MNCLIGISRGFMHVSPFPPRSFQNRLMIPTTSYALHFTSNMIIYTYKLNSIFIHLLAMNVNAANAIASTLTFNVGCKTGAK
jgi:hypothetical protein